MAVWWEICVHMQWQVRKERSIVLTLCLQSECNVFASMMCYLKGVVRCVLGRGLAEDRFSTIKRWSKAKFWWCHSLGYNPQCSCGLPSPTIPYTSAPRRKSQLLRVTDKPSCFILSILCGLTGHFSTFPQLAWSQTKLFKFPLCFLNFCKWYPLYLQSFSPSTLIIFKLLLLLYNLT